jgi:hypothetical protein
MGVRRGANSISVGRPEGTSPLGKPGHSWVANIKMYFQEVGWGTMDWIVLAQDKDTCRDFVNAVMNFRFP